MSLMAWALVILGMVLAMAEEVIQMADSLSTENTSERFEMMIVERNSVTSGPNDSLGPYGPVRSYQYIPAFNRGPQCANHSSIQLRRPFATREAYTSCLTRSSRRRLTKVGQAFNPYTDIADTGRGMQTSQDAKRQSLSGPKASIPKTGNVSPNVSRRLSMYALQSLSEFERIPSDSPTRSTIVR